jgi:DNA mismatch endonuclease Vsr
VRPDVVFTRARVCCFIDGCWWHGCRQHGRRRTSANDEYWSAKIARNVEEVVPRGVELEVAVLPPSSAAAGSV